MTEKERELKVEALRKQAEITQVQLAYLLGITDHTYRNWIKGRTQPELTIPQIKKLCIALKCSLFELPDDFTELADM